MTERTCPQCNVTFAAKGKRKFCSQKCANRFSDARKRLNLSERTCETCGTAYKPRLRKQRFCSAECSNTFHNKNNLRATPKADASHIASSVTPPDLLAYILSDSIFSGAIPDELARLVARNATFLLALIWMASPVAGLRPMRAPHQPEAVVPKGNIAPLGQDKE